MVFRFRESGVFCGSCPGCVEDRGGYVTNMGGGAVLPRTVYVYKSGDLGSLVVQALSTV